MHDDDGGDVCKRLAEGDRTAVGIQNLGVMRNAAMDVLGPGCINADLVWQSPPLQGSHARSADTVVGVPRDTRPMAYDEELANRIREVVQGEHGLAEKRMFGGLAFLIDGNMAVSASGQGGLLLRVDPAQSASLISEPHARRFEMRGREMDGWLRIDVAAVETDADLRRWVSSGVSYARSLPPK
ncbi:MAG: hypothetical protein QOE89_4176 [Pseudonocardiales bacterium]|nr:hypothetical protein [Pseudonocardiales bacterium]